MMIRIASVLALLAVLIPATAVAQTGRFEIYAGIYSPQDLDDEATFGLRAGCKPFERVGFDITAGTFTIKEDPVEIDTIVAHPTQGRVFHAPLSFFRFTFHPPSPAAGRLPSASPLLCGAARRCPTCRRGSACS